MSFGNAVVLAEVGVSPSNLMAPDEMKNLGFAEDGKATDGSNQISDTKANTNGVNRSGTKIS